MKPFSSFLVGLLLVAAAVSGAVVGCGGNGSNASAEREAGVIVEPSDGGMQFSTAGDAAGTDGHEAAARLLGDHAAHSRVTVTTGQTLLDRSVHGFGRRHANDRRVGHRSR